MGCNRFEEDEGFCDELLFREYGPERQSQFEELFDGEECGESADFERDIGEYYGRIRNVNLIRTGKLEEDFYY